MTQTHNESVITIRCAKCNQRMFDYISGDLHISMKCTRCRRVLVFKNLVDRCIQARSRDGVLKV